MVRGEWAGGTERRASPRAVALPLERRIKLYGEAA
jgi:hypothetical protein